MNGVEGREREGEKSHNKKELKSQKDVREMGERKPHPPRFWSLESKREGEQESLSHACRQQQEN